jgi:hypothetical protein
MTARSDWAGGVAASHAEMEAIDDDEALAMTYAERLALVWQLSQAFDWSEDDDDGSTVRLLGPDCGVRRAGS